MPHPSFARFLRSDRGSISVEAVFALPILILVLTLMFVIYDVFKAYNINQRAAYTIADNLSRSEVNIDGGYLKRMADLHDWLSQGDGANRIVVSVVTKVEDEATEKEELQLVWSRSGKGEVAYTEMSAIENRVPDMALGDQVVVVEAWEDWSPDFRVGLPPLTLHHVAVSRPRFAPRLDWADSTAASAPATGGSDTSDS